MGGCVVKASLFDSPMSVKDVLSYWLFGQTRSCGIRSELELTRSFSDEDAGDYCRRRNKTASRQCASHGKWVDFWFQRAVDWDQHIRRAHSPLCWSSLLQPFHNDAWLARQRLQNNARTCTRIAPGRPAMRWHDGVSIAKRSQSAGC